MIRRTPSGTQQQSVCNPDRARRVSDPSGTAGAHVREVEIQGSSSAVRLVRRAAGCYRPAGPCSISNPMAKQIFTEAFTTDPYWWEAAPPPDPGETDLPSRVEVAVIGSGYTGLSAALTLARGGREVIILEAGVPGQGASARNAGSGRERAERRECQPDTQDRIQRAAAKVRPETRGRLLPGGRHRHRLSRRSYPHGADRLSLPSQRALLRGTQSACL